MGFNEDSKASGGILAASFKPTAVGDGFKGEVLGWRETGMTKFGSDEPLLDKNGNVINQYVVTVQTHFRNWDRTAKPLEADGKPLPPEEDDGKRNVYIKYATNTGEAARAVKAAMPEADDLSDAIGGTLMGKLAEERPTTKGNPFMVWEYRFEAPPKAGGFTQAAAEPEQPQAAEPAPAPAQSSPVEAPF